MLAALLAGFASGETMMAVRRLRRAVVAYSVALVFILCGVGFLIGAGYTWTAQKLGPIEAALVFAAGFLVVGFGILLVHGVSAKARAQRAARRRKSDMTKVGVTAALAMLPGLTRSRAGLGIGALLLPAAAIAAYFLLRKKDGEDPDADE